MTMRGGHDTHGGCIECTKARSVLSMYDGAVHRMARKCAARTTPSARLLADLDEAKANRAAARQRLADHLTEHP